ncbi:CD276 antigen-like [Clupea harengus]|uniref:CD276 antigen-like n=1 Tax=Clupea harengus TaxID=7950 RepID=A0A6P8GAM9_CLUHA|nr:CD276 antigen-like [Clupea harengus]
MGCRGAVLRSLLFVLSSVVASYKVQVPSEPLVAVRGSYAVLCCSYPPMAQPGIPPGLLVTWQRVEDSRVVHSFYYGQNQLSRQSADFKNRTGLYVSELWSGNASLRITDVRAQDAGRYLCTVSDARGTDRAEMKVEYAAYYSEPQLSIEVGLHNTSVRFESDGFPKAEVQWLGPQEQELEHQSEFIYRNGVFYLRTFYVVQDQGVNASLTFRLSNHLLDQLLVRRVHFSQGQGTTNTRKDNSTVTALSCTCVILGLVCAALLFHNYRNHRKHTKSQPGSGHKDVYNLEQYGAE